MKPKFRAWDKHAKKWHTRVLVGTECCSSVYDEDGEIWLEFDEFCGDIVQWTGFNDRNGVEIYESHIIRCTDDANEMSDLNSDTGIGVVEWLESEGFWNVSARENALADLIHQGYVEVLGNIFENPELLKET